MPPPWLRRNGFCNEPVTGRSGPVWYNAIAMRVAMVDGQLVGAGPQVPKTAICPACGGEVRKRKRRGARGKITWFWRHQPGSGEGCPERFNPNGD